MHATAEMRTKAGTPTTLETSPSVSVGTPPTAIKVATDRDTKL
jgi:hypothetical protein